MLVASHNRLLPGGSEIINPRVIGELTIVQNHCPKTKKKYFSLLYNKYFLNKWRHELISLNHGADVKLLRNVLCLEVNIFTSTAWVNCCESRSNISKRKHLPLNIHPIHTTEIFDHFRASYRRFNFTPYKSALP